VSTSGDSDCSFVIAFYSISFQYPAPSSAGRTIPDPFHPPGQTLALVGPGPGKTIRKISPLSDPKRPDNPRISIFAPSEPARLAWPGQGRHHAGLCNCNVTVRRFEDITHQPAPLHERYCPGSRIAPMPPASSIGSLNDGNDTL
jgi:hypothetical protein